MGPDWYQPGVKAKLALERLMKHWEVKRNDCTPMEKAGFTLLVKRGLVRNKRGTYLRPDFGTPEEVDLWFDWLEGVLGITREAPSAVGARHPGS